MKSFRDIIGSVAAGEQNTPAAPTIQVQESTGAARSNQSTASPVKRTGFGAMLQRVADQSGSQVVSVLEETATTPVNEAPSATREDAAPVQEGFVANFIDNLKKSAADPVGNGFLSTHHARAHDHLDEASNALLKAHAAIKEAHALSNCPDHKRGLDHQAKQIEHTWGVVQSAKETGNLANHHYMKSNGQLK